MQTGTLLKRFSKKSGQQPSKYVPNFIDPHKRRGNWLKLMFWAIMVIVLGLVALVAYGY